MPSMASRPTRIRSAPAIMANSSSHSCACFAINVALTELRTTDEAGSRRRRVRRTAQPLAGRSKLGLGASGQREADLRVFERDLLGRPVSAREHAAVADAPQLEL